MSVSVSTTAYVQTDQGETPVTCVMTYEKNDDPFAVMFGFTGADSGVTWTFGRELLDEGIRSSAGLGDVRLRRSGQFVEMTLSSPSGTAVIRFDIAVVQKFLRLTYNQVPSGQESRYIDWDEFLRSL